MNISPTKATPISRMCKLLSLTIFFSFALNHSSTFADELKTVSLHALVIGNSAYTHKPLVNPKNDAQLMTSSLRQVGFKVKQVNNLDRKAFFSNIRDFYNNLPKNSVAMVYYAGHGVQIGGANYLIPVDMALTSERLVEVNALPLKVILDGLSTANSVVNVVVLDACRNNPFQPVKPSKYRSLETMGLTRVISPKGAIIAYSTAPGQLAEDGLGNKNSLYTSILAEEIKKPGLPIEAVFKKVADAVRKKTFDDQQPWYESSLVDDFYFQPLDGVKTLSPKITKRPNGVKNNQASRNMQFQESLFNTDWYMFLNNDEWGELDYEIQRRATHLTEDELPLLHLKAKKNHVVALTTLGIAYREGLKKIVDAETGKVFRTNASNKKSIEFLTKAAELGFPVAQVELGEMLFLGKHMDKDLNKSKEWLELAGQAKHYARPKLDLIQLKLMSNNRGSESKLEVDNIMDLFK